MKTSTGERNNGRILCIEIEPSLPHAFPSPVYNWYRISSFFVLLPTGLGLRCKPTDGRVPIYMAIIGHGSKSDWNLFANIKRQYAVSIVKNPSAMLVPCAKSFVFCEWISARFTTLSPSVWALRKLRIIADNERNVLATRQGRSKRTYRDYDSTFISYEKMTVIKPQTFVHVS